MSTKLDALYKVANERGVPSRLVDLWHAYAPDADDAYAPDAGGEPDAGDAHATYDAHVAGDTHVVFASAPARVELAGNHTDHQGGCTISGAIDTRAWALAVPHQSNNIHLIMDGFGEATFALDDLDPRANERGTSLSLARGMAASCVQAGVSLCGCSVVTCSDIPVGCGMSSSAAFEMMVGSALCACAETPVELGPYALAHAGVQAERAYFGKHCGYQDQLASAFGGLLALDFAHEQPQVKRITFNEETFGFDIVVIDCKSDHSRFTHEYEAVPADMFAVAKACGHARLEEVPYSEFLANLAAVRAQLGDRLVLRALHYFEETRRVRAQQQALEAGDYKTFAHLMRLSGASSAQYLQNVSPRTDAQGDHQEAMVVLALCAHLLDGSGAMQDMQSKSSGAYRIHGGGFGGSVLALVPRESSVSFMERMDTLLGYQACRSVSLTSRGAEAERIAL